jgi:uncharacterized repeat protein (TIGR01451 family)
VSIARPGAISETRIDIIRFDDTCTAQSSAAFTPATYPTYPAINQFTNLLTTNGTNICGFTETDISCFDSTLTPNYDLSVTDVDFDTMAMGDNLDLYLSGSYDLNQSPTVTIGSSSFTPPATDTEFMLKINGTTNSVDWNFQDATTNIDDVDFDNGGLVVLGTLTDNGGTMVAPFPNSPTYTFTDANYRGFLARLDPANGDTLWSNQVTRVGTNSNGDVFYDGDNDIVYTTQYSNGLQYDDVTYDAGGNSMFVTNIDGNDGNFGSLVSLGASTFRLNASSQLGDDVDRSLLFVGRIGSGTQNFGGVQTFTSAQNQLVWATTTNASGRILDCRLPSDPLDPLSTPVKVAPIIEPNYAKVGNDQFGLAKSDNGNIYTVNSPSRSLYGDGASGPSNTQLSLYQQPLSFNTINPADAVNSPSTPGSITSTTVTGGFTGRPMDIETRSFNGTNSIYLYALRPATGVTTLAVDSDITGDVVGFIVEVDPTTGAGTLYADNLPAGGYGKLFSDMSIDSAGNVYLDDVRSSFSPTNDYTFIPRVDTTGTVNPTFAQPTLNTFYDVATDDSGNAYSLLGSGNPAVRTKVGIYQIDPSGSVTTLPVSLPVPSDGGDIEVADADNTYDTALIGTDYIYYSSGFGATSEPAMVRINPDGSTTVSNGESVDANFTSDVTGYMDKIIMDLDNQIIYYKNGSRTANDPDQTIGKIYCPTQDQVDTPPPANPGPDPEPGDPLGPGDPGTPESFSGGTTYDSDIVLTKTTSAGTNAVNQGDTVVFTLSVANTGTIQETNITITDLIDADLTFSGTNTCLGDVTTCSFDSGTSVLSWTIPTLDGGSTLTFSYSAVVN